MDIQLQGINPVFATPLLLAFIVAILFFTWWSYSYLKNISPQRKWGLITLRSSALLILILLLLNPFLQIDETEIHNPQIAVYLDDSQSMSIARGEYDGWETYVDIIESFELHDINEAEIRYFKFDGLVEPAGDHELDLQGGITNLDEVMRHIRDQSDHTIAAVLFSDGIVTRGRDPLFNARELAIPLFTVPVGDTTETRDIAVSEVLTNETGYVNTTQPVEITVSQEGFPDETANLRLLRDDQILESESIDFDGETSLHRVTFNLEFEEEGLHNYVVSVTEFDEEVTTVNNTYPFSVNVVDEKINIYHLAFEIHPDVRMIRTILETDQNITLNSYTWVGSRFLEQDQFEAELSDIDLLVIHGDIPEHVQLPEGIPEQVPTLQFATPESGGQNQSTETIGLQTANWGSVLGIHLQLADENRNHPVTELPPVELNRQPALYTRYADYEIPPTASVLFHAIHRGAETDIPVVLVQETGNIRRTFVNAYGWFLYSQASDEGTREFNQQLMTNLAAWTSTSPDRDHLRISPSKRVYQEGEEVTFRADLTSETGEPETDAVVEITILKQEEDEERGYSMRHVNRGNYTLSIGTLASGNYQFLAEARKAGRLIDSAEGELSVTASTLEFVNTKRDDDLLRQLADITGGAFLEDYENGQEQLLNSLREMNLLQQIEEPRTAFRFLHEHLIWFVIVILLLSAEWLLRRKFSLP